VSDIVHFQQCIAPGSADAAGPGATLWMQHGAGCLLVPSPSLKI
jgi:hypothetical protein